MEKMFIYGAGEMGKGYLKFLKEKGLASCVAGICDRNYLKIGEVEGFDVVAYETLKQYGLPCLLAVANDTARLEVSKMLEQDKIKQITLDSFAAELNMDKVTFNREFCAFFHKDNMEEYYAQAEESLGCFWDEGTPFYERFQQLDLNNVIELACGRGRHVTQYVDKAKSITLVDILDKNIEFCRERFQDYSHISYYCNNGYNLEKLPDDTYSALFCYDAMVHFEMMDIYEYLKDIYRVMAPGGKVLIHHSNNDSDYKASFQNALNARNYMSKSLFAYLAYRVGFEVLDQQVIPWGTQDLDCITLLEKC